MDSVGGYSNWSYANVDTSSVPTFDTTAAPAPVEAPPAPTYDTVQAGDDYSLSQISSFNADPVPDSTPDASTSDPTSSADAVKSADDDDSDDE